MNFFGYISLYFTRTYLLERLLVWDSLFRVLSILGAIWLIIEFSNFFDERLGIFVKETIGIWYIIGSSLILTVIWRRPESKVEEKIEDHDAYIRIRVGDILKQKQACVIGSNTTFDTRTTDNLISLNSLQGQFTQKYYDDCTHLDADISPQLAQKPDVEVLPNSPVRKGKYNRYPIGSVVKVSRKGRNFYLLACAHMSERGAANTNMTKISDSLNSLWQYLAEDGHYEKELLMPVLGTGPGRVTETREEIIQEIITSFIAASTQQRFCECLTIVIHTKDFYRFKISMSDLKQFLTAQCRYSKIRRTDSINMGTSAS